MSCHGKCRDKCTLSKAFQRFGSKDFWHMHRVYINIGICRWSVNDDDMLTTERQDFDEADVQDTSSAAQTSNPIEEVTTKDARPRISWPRNGVFRHRPCFPLAKFNTRFRITPMPKVANRPKPQVDYLTAGWRLLNEKPGKEDMVVFLSRFDNEGFLLQDDLLWIWHWYG